MNRSKIALAMSAVLLTMWAVPAEAQRARPKRTGAASQSSSKKKLRGKKPTGAAQGPSAAELPASLAPEASAPQAAPQQPASAPPPVAPRQTGNTLESTGDRPWARGIVKKDQEAALALFQAGNTLLKESIFLKAVENYRKALALWKHPAIHYNLALALMNLDQPIEVHEHLVEALRYGPEPLENEKFEYARNYKTLIEKQLARVDISCDSPGAIVTMDGQTLFVGPGRHQALVRPGAHSILATREGYVPSDMSRTILPGETAKLDLKLYTDDDLIQYKRRWPVATPWLAVGAGVVVAAGSGWLHLQARDSLTTFDQGVDERGGVQLAQVPDLQSSLNRGNTFQNLAIGGYALGGAALITGAVLVYLNQPQPYRVDPNQKQAEAVTIAPLLGGGTHGAQALFRF
jgi:tetratricopeptide (TPR) repeat protein